MENEQEMNERDLPVGFSPVVEDEADADETEVLVDEESVEVSLLGEDLTPEEEAYFLGELD